MPLPSPINVGAAPNDGKGDPLRTSLQKSNAREQWLEENKAPKEAPAFSTRTDLATPAFSSSLRDDGAGNLGLFVGPAGAADGAQVLVASFNKATGRVKFGPPTGDAPITVGTAKPISFYTNPGNDPAVLWRSGDALRFGTTTDGVGTAGFIERVRVHPDGRISIGNAAATAELGLWAMGGDQDVRFQINANGDKSAQFGRSAGLTFIDCGNVDPFAIYINGVPVINTSSSGTYFGGFVASNADNRDSLGGPSSRWSVVYAGTGTINTSDATEKVDATGAEITEATDWAVTPPTEAEMRVARRLRGALGFFKFKGAVAEKGFENARRHFGLTVQFALQVCEDEGVDPWSIGIFCRDEVTRRVMVTQTRTVQATREVEEPFNEIEVRDGVPVQLRKTRMVERKLFEMRPALDEAGAPVMQAVPPIVGEDGDLIEQEPRPLMYPVPVMVEREVPVEIDEPAGERLGFRPDQLALFMMRGLVDAITPDEM